MAKEQRRKRGDRIVEGHPVWDALADAQTVRDGRVMCPLCDRMWPRDFADAMHVDHIIPTSKGGTDEPENLQLTCPRCNVIKKGKSQAEARELCLERRTMTGHEWDVLMLARGAARQRAMREADPELMRLHNERVRKAHAKKAAADPDYFRNVSKRYRARKKARKAARQQAHLEAM